MSRQTRINKPSEPLNVTNGLCFAPGHPPAAPGVAAPVTPVAAAASEAIEPKPAARRRPQHAWEMTFDEFVQQFFPELCGNRTVTEAGPAAQRDAA